METMTDLQTVEDTWKKLAIKNIKAPRFKVIVRTRPVPKKTESGLLWLPPKAASMYGDQIHTGLIEATVLSIGPEVGDLAVGDRVCFKRMEFGWFYQFAEDDRVGWIHNQQIIGKVQE